LVKSGEVFIGLRLILGGFTTLAAFFGMMMNFCFLLTGIVSTKPQMVLGFLIIIVMGVASYQIGIDRFFMKRLTTKFIVFSRILMEESNMEKNVQTYKYQPITDERVNLADFADFADSAHPVDYASNATKGLPETSSLNLYPSDLLEESIVKLFKVAFDIDIKTCTKKEWAERITIKGGALKQWQSFIKLPQKGRVRNRECIERQ